MAWEDRSDRIEHEGPDLLWEQVADDLRADIKSGRLAPGSRLPNELELATIYGVARVTIRNALASLRREGLIIVTRGRGTFVRK
ncbi:winged helix-turn-helix domain-containing protein [Saccharomonospora sp.]|uniref:winged helix-turn-helix domain-containing protein n=1 Tax=Saccharomonospora sp. TaxID=33913 RepID=UPI00343C44C8